MPVELNSELDRLEVARLDDLAATLTAAEAAMGSANIFVDTAAGLAGTVNDEYFSVPSADSAEFVVLYKNNAGVAQDTGKRYPSASAGMLRLNAGNHYPLKQVARNGVTSAAPQPFVDAVVDIKVIGLAAGKYARLTWYGNGDAGVALAYRRGMVFDVFDASTFATASVVEPLITYDDTSYTETMANGMTTRIYAKTLIAGVSVTITYLPDVFALTDGTSVYTEDPAFPGYSWIIDPACYVTLATPKETGLTINAGKAFPLKSAIRNGINSAARQNCLDAILDVKAIGVPDGYYLRFAWYGNGTTAFGAPNYGMEFEIALASTYATSPTVEKVTLYSDAGYEEQVVSGTVLTRTYRSTSRPGLAISITYDKAVFDQTAGTSVVLNNSAQPGYSWIIDPACYVPNVLASKGVVASGALVYSHTDTETLIAWRYSDTQDIRIGIGRYGVNNINDIGAIAFKAHGGGPLTLGGVWAVMTPRSTDWIGPFIVNATSGGSGDATQFTGGNHGYSGAGGAPTAEQVYRKAFADGRPLLSGDVGSAGVLTFQWENLVQGSNTRDVPRYILREQHSFTVRPGTIETTARINAMEALTVRRYHGLQAYLAGFNGTVHFLNGQQSARVTWANGLSSGAISGYPNAWAANFRGANGFNLLMWTDRTYGQGILDNLAPTADLFFTASTKAYSRMVEDAEQLTMAAGASFTWRGGYAMSPDLGSGIDLGARYHDAGREVLVAAITSAGSGRVALPTPDSAGRETTTRSGSVAFSPRVEPDGVAVSAAGYAVGFAST